MTHPYKTNGPKYRIDAGCVIVAMVALLGLFFLIGEDRDMDKQDQPTKADKYRIYCNEFPMDAICAIKKNNNQKGE